MHATYPVLQVTASVLRNLSWRADGASKQTLREVGAVSGLMQAAMEGKKESTLKSILSALWNLSAHCSINKVGRNLTLECLSNMRVNKKLKGLLKKSTFTVNIQKRN